jgi:archaellum component FlaC
MVRSHPVRETAMSDSLVLEILQAIRGDNGKVAERLDEHGHRLVRIELELAGLRRDQANDAEARAEQDARLDRLRERVERIEQRFELVAPG